MKPPSLHERIKVILEREIQRLNQLSENPGLTLDDIRALDLLLKAARNWYETVPDPASDPSLLSEDDLVNGLKNSNQQR